MTPNYTLNARIYPVLLSLFPIVIIGIFYSLQLNNYLHISLSLGLTGALSFLLSQLGRDNGKKKEPSLWESWGGPPSVQVLRLTNSHIDKHTKKRIHDKLKQISPCDVELTEELERTNLSAADEVYLSWTKFMIARTRDTNKYSLLFQENVNYGFRRNLWGLKGFAISLIISCILASSIFHVFKYGLINIKVWPKEFFISQTVLVLMLLFWIIRVTKDWIKLASFAYAERLFENIE